MSITTGRMYDLLPVIVRQRDLEGGEPLKALFNLLAQQGRIVEDDLDRLYDNLFIETCDEWAIPYLGDLVGVKGLTSTGATGFSQRARVANTMAYRRRKGTASMLEQLALDTTGWRARAVEFFELLATTQWLNHLRLHSLHIPDLRRGDALDRIGTAFEEARHFVDVRRIASDRGRYNLPNLGLFLWRLQSDYLSSFTARVAPGSTTPTTQGRFHTNPLAADAPLFNRPQTETEITTLATEHHVPGALRRRALDAEVEARRDALVNGDVAPGAWFGREPVFQIIYRLSAGGAFIEVKPEEMLIANLEEPKPAIPEIWLRPPDKITYTRRSDHSPVDVPIKAAVDPVLGRIAFPKGVTPVEVRVSAAHGFPGDLGGGAYDRRETVEAPASESDADHRECETAEDRFPLAHVTWQAGVGRDLTPDPVKKLFNKFEDAVAAWNSAPAGTAGIIALLDNGTYDHGGVSIALGPKSKLLIVSAGWPSRAAAGGGTQQVPGDLTPAQRRAHLIGNIEVHSAVESELWFNGVLSEGRLRLLNAGGAGLAKLRLAHCTLVPKPGALVVQEQHASVTIKLYRSITGPLQIAAAAQALTIEESAVDAGNGVAIKAPQVAATIANSTIVGRAQVQQLKASNSIFTARVSVQRKQTGCVRFCFVPYGSETPRRYRCQPDLALEEAAPAAREAEIIRAVAPDFTDESYSRPAYLQLTRSTPIEIRTGADDGSEMGVWWFLRQPQREANLRQSLDEFLRLGLEAGLIFVT